MITKLMNNILKNINKWITIDKNKIIVNKVETLENLQLYKI